MSKPKKDLVSKPTEVPVSGPKEDTLSIPVEIFTAKVIDVPISKTDEPVTDLKIVDETEPLGPSKNETSPMAGLEVSDGKVSIAQEHASVSKASRHENKGESTEGISKLSMEAKSITVPIETVAQVQSCSIEGMKIDRENDAEKLHSDQKDETFAVQAKEASHNQTNISDKTASTPQTVIDAEVPPLMLEKKSTQKVESKDSSLPNSRDIMGLSKGTSPTGRELIVGKDTIETLPKEIFSASDVEHLKTTLDSDVPVLGNETVGANIETEGVSSIGDAIAEVQNFIDDAVNNFVKPSLDEEAVLVTKSEPEEAGTSVTNREFKSILDQDTEELLQKLEMMDNSDLSKLLGSLESDATKSRTAEASNTLRMADIRHENKKKPIYIYTSLAGGGFHMMPRTNRLVTILTANRIEFTYRDLGTDAEARKVWKLYSKQKSLPGIVRGRDEFIGNWQDIEDANEDYKLRELLYDTI